MFVRTQSNQGSEFTFVHLTGFNQGLGDGAKCDLRLSFLQFSAELAHRNWPVRPTSALYNIL